MTERIIYLDNNATTRPYPEVLETIQPFFEERYGNPSSVHQKGRDAKTALDEARATAAEAINADSPAEIVFVSCATEANNLALNGSTKQVNGTTPGIITSQIEHPSVLETCQALEAQGAATVTYLTVDENGFIDLADLRDAINENTELVSIMTANNEVGSVQPVQQIADICKENNLLFHTDAVQAPGKIPVDVQDPNVDLLALSAHKFHGPRGIGLLYKRKEIDLPPLLRGGGQEQETRSGTEPVALAAGLSTALDRATEQCASVSDHTGQLRKTLWRGIRDRFGDTAQRNTPGSNSLPNTLNVSFMNKAADKMLINLDLEGICVSAGSACHSGAIEISHVLQAMNVSEEAAKGSVRFSFSHENRMEDVHRTLEVLGEYAP